MPPAVRARILRDARMAAFLLVFPFTAPSASMGLMAIVLSFGAPFEILVLLVGGVFVAIAVGLVTWVVRGWIDVVRDLREGVILRTTGPVLLTWKFDDEGSDFHLWVAGRRFAVDGAAALTRIAAALGGDPEAVGASRSNWGRGKTSGWGTAVYAPHSSLLLEVWDTSGQVVYRESAYDGRMQRERGNARTPPGGLRRGLTTLGGLLALGVVGLVLGGWLWGYLNAGLSVFPDVLGLPQGNVVEITFNGVHVALGAHRGSLPGEAPFVLPFLSLLALSTVLFLASGPLSRRRYPEHVRLAGGFTRPALAVLDSLDGPCAQRLRLGSARTEAVGTDKWRVTWGRFEWAVSEELDGTLGVRPLPETRDWLHSGCPRR